MDFSGSKSTNTASKSVPEAQRGGISGTRECPENSHPVRDAVSKAGGGSPAEAESTFSQTRTAWPPALDEPGGDPYKASEPKWAELKPASPSAGSKTATSASLTPKQPPPDSRAGARPATSSQHSLSNPKPPRLRYVSVKDKYPKASSYEHEQRRRSRTADAKRISEILDRVISGKELEKSMYFNVELRRQLKRRLDGKGTCRRLHELTAEDLEVLTDDVIHISGPLPDTPKDGSKTDSK